MRNPFIPWRRTRQALTETLEAIPVAVEAIPSVRRDLQNVTDGLILALCVALGLALGAFVVALHALGEVQT